MYVVIHDMLYIFIYAHPCLPQFKLPPGATLLPIILYMDDTHVNFRGNRSFKPLVVCIGNYKFNASATNDGKRCAGYLPKQKLTKNDSTLSGPRRALNHALLANLVDNIEDYSGGFYLTLPFESTPRLFVEFIFYSILGDPWEFEDGT
jgi:hypothetical protein